MALIGTSMADAIVDALQTAGRLPGLSAGDITTMKADMTVWADAFILYFTTNAIISTTTSSVVVGTLPAGPVAATGTGVGTGTIA